MTAGGVTSEGTEVYCFHGLLRCLVPGWQFPECAAAPEIADRCKPLPHCDILPQQAETPREIPLIC
jgi:hypothetical protein